MEFVVILFTTIMTFNFWAVWETMDACGNDIIDIYYPVNQKNNAYHWDCPYTKTLCYNCAMRFIRRSEYDQFAKSYTDLGMNPPFPRRTDIDFVFKRKTY